MPATPSATTHPAAAELARALLRYHRGAARPRSADFWGEVQTRIWNARQNAVHAGVLDRASDAYEFVSARYRDAEQRREYARATGEAC